MKKNDLIIILLVINTLFVAFDAILNYLWFTLC